MAYWLSSAFWWRSKLAGASARAQLAMRDLFANQWSSFELL